MSAIAAPSLLDSPAGPLPLTGRVAVVDTLRALALFGVIVMNVMSMVMMFMGDTVMARAVPADMVVGVSDLVLLQGKARSCFALLFGVGFGVMLQRASSAGTGFNAFFLRRMAVLLAFGLFNQVFLFWGDILALYAVVGACLLLVRDWSDRRLLIGATLLVVGVPLLQLVYGGLPSPMGQERANAVIAAALQAFEQPQYGPRVMAANVSLLGMIWASDLAYKLVYMLGVLGLFMLGLLIARRGILFDIASHRPLLRRVAWVALPVGLGLSVLRAGLAGGWPSATPGCAGSATVRWNGCGAASPTGARHHVARPGRAQDSVRALHGRDTVRPVTRHLVPAFQPACRA